MGRTHADLLRWLHRLDTYTNGEFGRARTLCSITGTCVACGCSEPRCDEFGRCPLCARRRQPDHSDIVLFRPMARRAPVSD